MLRYLGLIRVKVVDTHTNNWFAMFVEILGNVVRYTRQSTGDAGLIKSIEFICKHSYIHNTYIHNI